MMTSTIRKFGVGVASIALVAGVAAPAMADPVDNRLAGADRYDTAIAVAMDKVEFSNPSVVYVARGDMLVDAITAGTLQDGPMLLVNDDAAVQDKVAAAIKQLGVSKVVVIGGEKAVSKETVEKIVPTGVTSERISGKDRYETAVNIGASMIESGKTTLDDSKKVYLANGMSLVDALVGGQLKDGPILLTDGSGKLPAATAKALNTKFYNNSVVALGGTKAVTNQELTAANVAKVIIPDTFIQDYKSEIKAAADAGLKVNGYLTVSNKAKKDDVIKNLVVPSGQKEKIVKAKVEATWPQIDRTYAPDGNYYIPTKDDGTVDTSVEQPAAKTTGYKSETLEGGAKALNFAGTSQNLENARTKYTKAAEVQTTIDTKLPVTAAEWNADDKVLGKNTNLKTTNLSANGKNQQDLFDALTSDNMFGELKSDGKKIEKSANFSVMQLVKAVIPTSVYDENVDSSGAFKDGSDLKVTSVKNISTAVKSAVKAKVDSLQSAISTARSANDSAVKAEKAASNTLSDRIDGRVPADSLNRISGSDRYSTSVAVAKAVFGDKGGSNSPIRIYFANGNSFADAAVSGMLTRGPVLLVGKDMIPGSVNDYAKAVANNIAISRKSVIALGGTGVIEAKNLTDEINTLSPISEGNKDYTASFAAASRTGDGQTVATIENVATSSHEVVINIDPTVENLPNGGNQKVFWQYNTGDGWNDLAVKGSKVIDKLTLTDQTSGSTTYSVKVATTGVQASATKSDVKEVQVRLVVRVTNANGDSIVADQSSTPVTVKYSVKS